MAEQTQPNTAKAQILNDRTYQEVEYLKKNLGPILVAALAEICIRRPADPIEYLGHWLLRWRYNEELKRRDVQNALEVVRQKAWTKDDESLQPNSTAPNQPPAPDTFTQGFVPGAAYAPPGYGGPLDQNVVEESMKPEGQEGAQVEGQRSSETAEGVASGEAQSRKSGEADGRKSGDAEVRKSGDTAAKKSGDAVAKTSGEKQNEMAEGQDPQGKTSPTERRASQQSQKRASGQAAEGDRTSLGGQDQEKRASGEVVKAGSGEQQQPTEERRASRKSVDQVEKRTSGQADVNNAEAPPAAPGGEEENGEEEETIPE